MPNVPVACTTDQHHLGEGVRWDAQRGELLRVDILQGTVHRDRVAVDGGLLPVAVHAVAGTVGAAMPVAGGDGWLLAANRGFTKLSPDGSVRELVVVAPADSRMNDAACDPQGRCWAGTIAHDHRPGGGALHRLDGSGRVEQMLEGLTISNGLGWSPDAGTMYLADSAPRVVHAFAFDGNRGTIDAGRVLIRMPDGVGSPDGLTVDAAGDLWIAMFGGAQVRRYSPDGELRDVLRVPAVETTCCAFGGAMLDRLFVTTATEHWTDEQRRADPAAGLVYRFDTNATGVAATPFRPDPRWWAPA